MVVDKYPADQSVKVRYSQCLSFQENISILFLPILNSWLKVTNKDTEYHFYPAHSKVPLPISVHFLGFQHQKHIPGLTFIIPCRIAATLLLSWLAYETNAESIFFFVTAILCSVSENI